MREERRGVSLAEWRQEGGGAPHWLVGGAAVVLCFKEGRTWKFWACILMQLSEFVIYMASKYSSLRGSFSLSRILVPSSRFCLVTFELCLVL